MRLHTITALTLSSTVLAGATTIAQAQQDYPNRPIRYIVPYSPGGSTTWTSRLVGERLTEVWGQQVLIDNRPGANTVLGTHAGVRSKPDGYTLIYIGSALASNVSLVKDLPYDALKDVAPVATVSSYENLFAVHPTLPVKSVKEFVALAKKRPGELNYASSSHGGSTNLAPQLFNMVAGIKTVQVPYKGIGSAMSDVMGGQVQFVMAVPVNVVALVQNKKLRALAITGDQRLNALPEVPTMKESGYPDVTLKTWQGLGAPAGTPKAILDKIAAEVQKLVASAETVKKLDAQGFMPYFNGPDRTGEILKQDIARFAKIIKAAGIQYE